MNLPPLHRFFFRGCLSDNHGHHATVGGYYHAAAKRTPQQLIEAYTTEASAVYAGRGAPDARPTKITSTMLHEQMPELPRPSPSDQRPLRRWKVSADIAIHDIKYTTMIHAVFQWPEPPAGAVLYQLLDVILAQDLVDHGHEVSYSRTSEIRSHHITETNESPTHL